MQQDIRVLPADIRRFKAYHTAVSVKNTDAGRTKGFQDVLPVDATMPILMTWNTAEIRILHNDKVLFDVDAYVIDHKGYVQQHIILKAGDSSQSMTSPCRAILEIPEFLEGITVQNGDKILF
mgnify:CR=1 FL=1|jgi:hypothetical protein